MERKWKLLYYQRCYILRQISYIDKDEKNAIEDEEQNDYLPDEQADDFFNNAWDAAVYADMVEKGIIENIIKRLLLLGNKFF